MGFKFKINEILYYWFEFDDENNKFSGYNWWYIIIGVFSFNCFRYN